MASNGLNIYEAVRWVFFIALVLVVLLILKRPTPAAAPLSVADVAAKSQEFSAKLEELRSAQESAESGTEATFTSDEVNSFIADSSVRAAQQAARSKPPVLANPGDGPDMSSPVNPEELKAALDKTQIAFAGDEVIAQTSVQRYGRDIYLTVRGRLGAKDGYVNFEPTEFKIGSLSVPVNLVNDRLQAKLAEPENHDKLKLPDFISDLRIENGQLKIREK